MSDRLRVKYCPPSPPQPPPPHTHTYAPPPHTHTYAPPRPGKTFDHENRPFPFYFPLFYLLKCSSEKPLTLCLFVVWVSFVVCKVSWAPLWKLNQGQTRKWLVTGRPPSVSGAVVDWNPSLSLLNTDEQYSGCNFLQNADFKRISINNSPINRGWFPCGLMCDWSVMSLQWLSKCTLGRLPFMRVLQTQEINQIKFGLRQQSIFSSTKSWKKKKKKRQAVFLKEKMMSVLSIILSLLTLFLK